MAFIVLQDGIKLSLTSSSVFCFYLVAVCLVLHLNYVRLQSSSVWGFVLGIIKNIHILGNISII